MDQRPPQTQSVASLDDPRIAVYRDLPDRQLDRLAGRFIAEGRLVVERLLESDYTAESVLLAERRVAGVLPLVPPDVPVYVAAQRLVERIVGFRFHSGVIACGLRRDTPSLDDVAPGWAEDVTLAVLPDIANTENLGGLLRISAAFGADAVVLGPSCCDPFYRQAVRVSMGTVFSLPLVRSKDLAADLERLREKWHVELAAAVLDGDAEPLSRARRGRRLGLLFGNEATGLAPEHVALCDRKITVPMKLGADSLNVAVAAAVFLHHFTTCGAF